MLSNATMAVVMAALEYSRSTMLAFGNVPVGDSSIDELDAALAELQAAQAAGEWRPVLGGMYGQLEVTREGRIFVDYYNDIGQLVSMNPECPSKYRLCEYTGSQEGRDE